MNHPKVLSLYLLPSVPAGYSNNWWSQSIKESISFNQSYELKVLTEKQLQIDVALAHKRYIPYPTFKEKVEKGFYHINIQDTKNMFSGFLCVLSDEECYWWATDNGDRVVAGFAGIDEHRYNHITEITNWLGSIIYQDRFPIEATIFDILKPF